MNVNLGVFHALVNGVQVEPVLSRYLRPSAAAATKNWTIAYLFHVASADPVIQFKSGAAGSAGVVHCDQFSGTSGLEHFGANQNSGSTFLQAGIQSVCPNNILVFGTFSSAGVSSTTVAATAGSMTKTSLVGFPSQIGTTGFVRLSGLDPIPSGYSVTSTWPAPAAGLSMLIIGSS